MSGGPRAAGTLYFAYGSNMDPGQMARRCPGAHALGRASLAGHGFRINSRGVATVVPEVRGLVHGVLWRLNAAHVATLDRYEGVASGEYRRQRLAVRAHEPCEALVYVASEQRGGTPRAGYLERVVAGAVHFGLPYDYVSRLESWAAGTHVTGEAR